MQETIDVAPVCSNWIIDRTRHGAQGSLVQYNIHTPATSSTVPKVEKIPLYKREPPGLLNADAS